MASIAEVIGAVAIEISLIYVGVHVNDSTRAVRSATVNEKTSAISSWYAQVGSDQQAGQVVADGMTDPDSLTNGERVQFIYQMMDRCHKS